MAPLSAASVQALARLRAYVPPPTIYSSLPLSRRAAVLILLFADRRGDLRVVLTIRASTLKSYPGQAAFPGGKADSLSETPFQTARREAHEEIGLPPADADLPPPFRVEHLCELPTNLARTELGVRPCVAFLHDASEAASSSVQDTLIPRLDAREVAAVFSAPFHDFLSATATAEEGEGEWYEGSWTNWHGTSFRMHNFFVPLPTPSSSSPPHSSSSAPQSAVERHRVFGMTARILVDGARVAYAEPPAFAHLPHLGDEELLRKLSGMGRLGEKEAVREIGEGGGKGAKM